MPHSTITMSSAHAESATRDLIIQSNGFQCMVEVAPTDTFSDVRSKILEDFDDGMLPARDFIISINNVCLSRKQETRKLAWEVAGQEDPIPGGKRSVVSLHGSYTLGSPKLWQLQTQQGGLPPRTPPTNRHQNVTAPPSTGKAAPKQTKPRKSPSSEEGKLEGLSHASDDSNNYMQCTSTPAVMALLEILEKAVEDQQNGALDDKFNVAAKYVMRARNLLMSRKVPEDMGMNERFFTGAMANAINSNLKDGYCVLHHACLGAGFTHSGLSATRIGTNAWPTTLMVGEGKWNASNLRDETRGQMFNELLRHRAIDRQNEGEGNNGPILLVAFDKNKIEIDLAFPSTKGGKLERDEVVSFSEHMEQGKETFWTVRILRISIDDGNGRVNLPLVLRFISDALEKLDSWSGQGRVQHKMPMLFNLQDENAAVVQYCGENVTIIEETSGSKFVYKEYSYHLRQASSVMTPLYVIEEKDKRQPPPKELLQHLGSPYLEWAVHKGPFGASVLRYPFIEGSSYNPSVAGWIKILLQIQRMHEIDFVHGDLLPRNVLFDSEGGGYVIDFDLSRKLGGVYVRGYNYIDFQEFRHEGAREGQHMSKDHDLHSLHEMSYFFFDLRKFDLRSLGLDELINFFRNYPELPPNVELNDINDEIHSTC